MTDFKLVAAELSQLRSSTDRAQKAKEVAEKDRDKAVLAQRLLKREISELKEQLDAKDGESQVAHRSAVSAVVAERDKVQTELVVTKAALATAQAELRAAKAQLGTLSTELTSTQDSLRAKTELYDSVKSGQAELAALRERSGALESAAVERDMAVKVAKEAQQALQAARDLDERRQKTIAAMVAKHEELVQLRDEADARADGVTEELQHVLEPCKHCAELRAKVHDLTVEADRLAGMAATTKAAPLQPSSTAPAAVAAAAAAAAAGAETIEGLKTSVSALKARLSRAEFEKEDLGGRVQLLVKETADLKAINRLLKAKRDEQTAIIADLTAMVAEFQRHPPQHAERADAGADDAVMSQIHTLRMLESMSALAQDRPPAAPAARGSPTSTTSGSPPSRHKYRGKPTSVLGTWRKK